MLRPMTLPSSEQRRGAMALVVVGHRSSPPLLHGQAGLGAVERLDLALLIDRQDDGVSRRVDVETDHITQLVDKLGIVGELELLDLVRPKPVRAPDALDGADADPHGLRHHRAGPVCDLEWRSRPRERDDTFDHTGVQRRSAGLASLVPQQPVHAFLHKALLPAPDAGLRLASSPHDLVGAEPFGRKQNDLRPPHMLLGCIAILQQRRQAAPLRRSNRDGNPFAHAPDSHAQAQLGIPLRIQMSGSIH